MIVAYGTQNKKLIVPQYSEKKLSELLVEMIIMNEINLLAVEGKRLSQICCNYRILISHTFIVHSNVRLYEDVC